MRICGFSIRRSPLSTGTGAVNGVAASLWQSLVRKLGAVEARIARLQLVAGAWRSPSKGGQSEHGALDTPGLVAWAQTIIKCLVRVIVGKKQGQSQLGEAFFSRCLMNTLGELPSPNHAVSHYRTPASPKACCHPKSKNLSDRSPHAKPLHELSMVLSTLLARRQGIHHLRRPEAATQPLSYSI